MSCKGGANGGRRISGRLLSSYVWDVFENRTGMTAGSNVVNGFLDIKGVKVSTDYLLELVRRGMTKLQM